MYLHIAPTRTISDIQEEFSHRYSFLKLEFFHKKVLANADFSASQRVPGSWKISDIQRVPVDGKIEVVDEMTVNTLEKKLKDEFGIAAQVFRKSGKLWLETTITGYWSLKQQNNHGMEISKEPNSKTGLEDFDLNRDADH
jgi:hypothetical protein